MEPPVSLRGLDLARGYYEEVVKPIVERRFPGLPHAAALVGNCSDVLGYDTDVSRDHEWGPRLQLFLAAPHMGEAAGLAETLRHELPVSYRGYPTNYTPAADEPIRRMTAVPHGPVEHAVDVTTVGAFCRDQLGFDPLGDIETAHWLAAPQQRLLSMTAGAVFRDDVGELTAAREALAWYPEDVWRALMARQWARIAEREAFPGRAESVGDTLGCTLLVGQIVRDLMRLAFLIERRYAPYAKWLGTAFASLASAAELGPDLARALGQSTWRSREQALGRAYEKLARMHNALEVTPPLEPSLRSYHDRPFLVIGADRFATALREGLAAPALREASQLGGVDQWVDAVEVLETPELAARVTDAAIPRRGR
jgi:hypothetical protein